MRLFGLNRLLGRASHSVGAAESGTANPEAWLTDLLGGMVTATGLRVSVRDALTVPGVSACIQCISDDLARVPLLVQRRSDKSRATSHYLYKLLKERPSPWLSSYAWRRALIANACGWGNGYSRVRRDEAGARVEQLTLIQPGRTLIRWDDDGQPFFDVSRASGGVERGLSFQQVVHIPYRGSTDWAVNGGIVGVSPISSHRETIALAIATERFAARFFANGARPSMVVEMERRLPDDLFRRLRAQLEQTYGGIDNSFKIAILELGMKLKEVSATNSDSQLIEVRKESAAEQARLWRVPPHKIGVLDKATFSNIEQQNIEYVTDCLAPLASMVEQALTTALLSETEQDEYEIEFNLDGLLRGDLLSRYRAYSIGRQWGWLSADDIREAENKPSLPNGQGKVYLTPLNMVPAGEDPMNDGPADAPPAKPPSRATSLVDLHGRPLMLPAPAPTPAPTH